MKTTWEEKDCVPGRYVCKPIEYSGRTNIGNQAKWTHKIAYQFGSGDKKVITLVCMTDGLTTIFKNEGELAEYLNKNNMIPAPHYRVIEVINYTRDCYVE